MKTNHFFVFVVVILCGIMLQCASFDFYYFVLTWPESLCNLDPNKRSCCYPTKGGKPATDFIIHGLWPNFNNGSFPKYCDPKNPYDKNQVADLIGSMEKYWPSMSCPSNDGSKFWSHEWNKHGTCSKSVLNQHNYFLTTLNLRMKVDILSALKSAGIEPNGESYTVKAVENAITRAIGVTPKIKCRPDNWQQLQLYEIYFCVNTTNHFVPCNPSLDHQANCGSDTDQNIYFHKFDSDFSRSYLLNFE
ncbi:Ribonuclease T2-like [Trema orientale]|uniref:Ribonuclease T2-like n=1 Tax=Trema orientale TaxID=63057 RepID=A0A2P5FZ76_TREOI|nr:Ribonuclease T2-like [Trema orientale]